MTEGFFTHKELTDCGFEADIGEFCRCIVPKHGGNPIFTIHAELQPNGKYILWFDNEFELNLRSLEKLKAILNVFEG